MIIEVNPDALRAAKSRPATLVQLLIDQGLTVMYIDKTNKKLFPNESIKSLR